MFRKVKLTLTNEELHWLYSLVYNHACDLRVYNDCNDEELIEDYNTAKVIYTQIENEFNSAKRV